MWTGDKNMKAMKRNTYIYLFNTEKEGLTRSWNDLAVKKAAWQGSTLRAFSLSFGA